MKRFNALFNLIERIEKNETISRNTSELIKLIPWIGSAIESNTLGKRKDNRLNERLEQIERIAQEAINEDDFEKLLKIVEQNSIAINGFLNEYKDDIFESDQKLKDKISPIKIALSFVDQDYHIAREIMLELTKHNIFIFSKSKKIIPEINIYNGYVDVTDELPYTSEVLLVLLSNNYAKYNSSVYNKNSYLNSANRRKLDTFTFLVGEIEESNKKKIPIKTARFYTETQLKEITTGFIEFYKKKITKDYETIKHYKDVDSIIKFYNPEFRLIDKEERKTDKIGYKLFYTEDKIFKKHKSYFLYLYDGINQKRTYEFIKNKNPGLFVSQSLFILIDKPKNLKDPNERKTNLEELFKPESISFIDEFVYEHCTAKYFNKNESVNYEISNFIEPYLKYNDTNIDLTFIDNWLYKNANPILVITGIGGVGKTTLVKQISNNINQIHERTNVVYINAPEISQLLIQSLQRNEQLNLYSFYEADFLKSQKHKSKIDYDIFKINVDNGNILIIIDGLDEIISRLGEQFSVDDFFQSIFDFTNEVGDGKVIVTSRNYFWDISNSNLENIDVVEIMPFNKEKAITFFKKRYPNSPKLVDRGIEIAESILGDNNDKDYIPYVLELVNFMLEDGIEDGKYDDPDFISNTFNQNIKNDYIIGKICQRETGRVEQIGIDEQAKIFFKIALNNTNKDNFPSYFDSNIDKKKIEAFLSHPLLRVNHYGIFFRFDFFKIHFQNIYLSKLLINNTSINHFHIQILNENVRYNSSFVHDLSERIPNLTDDTLFVFLNIISQLEKYDKSREEISEIKIRHAISGIFVIALHKLHSVNNNNIEVNTKLMKSLFYRKGKIENFSIINLSATDKIIFDFRDLEFINNYFSSYDYFWECKFNTSTIFQDSYFYSLNIKDRLTTTAVIENFLNPSYDSSFTDVINDKTTFQETIKAKVISDLYNFIAIFCTSSAVETKPYDYVMQKHKRKALKTEDIIKILSKKVDLIEVYELKNRRRIRIQDKHRENVMKYFIDRTMSDIIKKSFNALYDKKNNA